MTDIRALNQAEIQRVEDAPSLYQSLLRASEGDVQGLHKQVYVKYYTLKENVNVDIRYTDKRLNNLAIRLKNKYANEQMSIETINVRDKSYAGTINRQPFSEQEIDDMMINFIFNFNARFVHVAEDAEIDVASIHSFKGRTDEHSNNKLIKYLIGKGKIGMIETGLIRAMEIQRDTKRHMLNGVRRKVDLNDIEVVNFDDVSLSNDEDNQISLLDVLDSEEDEGGKYQPTLEMAYIRNNLGDVLTNNQINKMEMLFDAVNNKKVDVEDLLHDVTDKLILKKLGDIWFPDKKNNYIQPQVKSLLDNMRKRMQSALKLKGFKNNEIRSDYLTLPEHSKEENKMLHDYKIWDRYLIRDVYIDNFHENMDIEIKNDEQFIPYHEFEKIENHEQSVKDVINKYGITKEMANNDNSTVKSYEVDEVNGQPLFTDAEMKERKRKHCQQLVDWIKEDRIVFQDIDGMMKPSNNKIKSITYEDYDILESRGNDEKLAIIEKYMNDKLFNQTNRYVLVDESYVNDKGDKYISKKNYSIEYILPSNRYTEKLELSDNIV